MINDVWSGGSSKDGKYPQMSYVIEKGLYHPRCKDAHTTYFPGRSTADDTWTQNELENIGLQAEREAKKQYAERQAKRFGRIARYSLDDENKKKYENKEKRWKTIEKSVDSDIIESVNTKEISDVEITTLGKINKVLMEKEFGRIQTDDIIITSE